MKNLDFDWLTDEFMLYCRSTQLKENHLRLSQNHFSLHQGYRCVIFILPEKWELVKMKKRSSTLFTVIYCVFLLSACGCRHEWRDADCLTAKICTLCEQTEGEALGHTWTEATCSEPKTCSQCGNTEGVSLGHCYSAWEVEDQTMNRTCSTCGTQETTDVDWNVYLSERISGRWYCVAQIFPVEVTYLDDENRPYLQINTDQSLILYDGETEYSGMMEYDCYTELGDWKSFDFYAVSEGERQWHFSYVPHQADLDNDDILYGHAGINGYRFEQEQIS